MKESGRASECKILQLLIIYIYTYILRRRPCRFLPSRKEFYSKEGPYLIRLGPGPSGQKSEVPSPVTHTP